jgi:hypothetical protein
MTAMNRLIAAYAIVLAAPCAQGAEPRLGEALMQEAQCDSCHVERFGGDGSQIYLRADRRVGNPAQLATQVSVCNSQLNTGWFPEDEAHVAAFLNQRYYRFK